MSGKCNRCGASWFGPQEREHICHDLLTSSYPLGLTKLEWFAGMALQGKLGNQSATRDWTKPRPLAEWIFDVAQAMLEESEKRHASQTGEREKDKYGYPIADEDPHD